MQSNHKSNDSGNLWIEEGLIHYESNLYGRWKTPITDIVLIGEYTNDNGPYVDDWFYVFMTAEQNWYEASVYAKKSDSFKVDLKKQFRIDIIPELSGSTDYNSRLLWPSHLAGKPLFDFRSGEGKTLGRRIKLVVFPEVQFDLSKEAEEYLQG